MQASLLASAALTAEVAALKQDLEGSKEELGLAKRNSMTHSSPKDEEEDEDAPPLVGGDKKRKAPQPGGGRVQEGKDSPSGLLHHRRRRWRRVAAQGQAPGEVVSIRIPE